MRDFQTSLTQSILKSRFRYDPTSGLFFSRSARRVVGNRMRDGYLRIEIGGRSYMAHRLAWLYMTGDWPTDQIDHANLDKTDNRIANLRLSDLRLNAGNCRRRRAGLKGATFHKQTGRWQASIKSFGRSKYLGLFDTEQAAHDAYATAAAATFGEFARLA